METCVRGFSYVPEDLNMTELQYVEDADLERTWKVTRRQRQKQQEQRIWDEFVQEQDIVNSVCKDDPYQFLEQLPEACLKELMDIELQKMRKEHVEEAIEKIIDHQHDTDERDEQEDRQLVEEVEHVSFTEEDDPDERLFHIFDSEKDEVSGPEDAPNEALDSPCTVRENLTGEREQSAQDSTEETAPDQEGAEKSSDNMTTVIENNIYCAKVKDLRSKISEEMSSIISSLETQNISAMESQDLSRMCRRSNEFCNRFSRIHMYQLQRQLQDIKRNNRHALPFAKHTQFQSLMVRVVSLHQNMLQAYQVFRKSLEQTACLRECSDLLLNMIQMTREASELCREAPAPKDFVAVVDLYNDDVITSSQRLEEMLRLYTTRITEYMNNIESNSAKHSKRSGRMSNTSLSGRGHPKFSSRSKADGKLSMYSLDTFRPNLHARSTSSKENQSNTSKIHLDINMAAKTDKAIANKTESTAKNNRKSPRCRRPLMRDPQQGRVRLNKPQKDVDIKTMVEAVEACTSSHISREPSPNISPRFRNRNTIKHENQFSSSKEKTLRKPIVITPRSGIKKPSPRYNNVSKADEATPSSNLKNKIPLDKADKECDVIENEGLVHEEMADIKKKDDFGKETERVRDHLENKTSSREKYKASNSATSGFEVTRLIQQLCSGDGTAGRRNERVSGSKNAQLLCINASSPRPPSTPQLLRILEETIQKKSPRPLQKHHTRDADRYRLSFNIDEKTCERLFEYRTKFVQHMLTSAMYANSSIGKPWEMIGSISEKILEDLLVNCAKEMELREVVNELYKYETSGM